MIARRTRIKICGFTVADDIGAALDLGIDAIGLNLARGPRRVSLDQAARLRQGIPPGVSTMGLFVDADIDTIRQAISTARLDWVQLHGDESPELAAALMTECRVLRACRVADADSLAAANDYPCHALLLDAYVPGLAGGSGQGWNHQLLQGWSPRVPWLLAGGIRPNTVGQSLAALPPGCRPWGIDCASGVESSPGRKDVHLMDALRSAVSDYDTADQVHDAPSETSTHA